MIFYSTIKMQAIFKIKTWERKMSELLKYINGMQK